MRSPSHAGIVPNANLDVRRAKTEAELISVARNMHEVEACLRFGQRAKIAGMPALAAACEERAKALRPIKEPGVRNASKPRSPAAATPLKSLAAAEKALAILFDDYTAGQHPTTYGDLARRCGFEGGRNVRWFGQVTDLIDAACALKGLPSFALVRVREANGDVNHAAWRKQFGQLREGIVARALAGQWIEADLAKMKDALAEFSRRGLGNKKAWKFVFGQINVAEWAGAAVP